MMPLLLFVQTFYLDNLEVTGGNIPHDEFPRIQFYTTEVINAIVEDDTRSHKGEGLVIYGRLLVRTNTTYAPNTGLFVCYIIYSHESLIIRHGKPRHEALVCYQRNPANSNNVAGASNVFNRSESRCVETGSMTIDEVKSANKKIIIESV